MLYTFRVLTITNNLDEYHQYEKDTNEFPDLVRRVEDEIETFVYCNETEDWWEAGEFLLMVDMKTFQSEDFMDKE